MRNEKRWWSLMTRLYTYNDGLASLLLYLHVMAIINRQPVACVLGQPSVKSLPGGLHDITTFHRLSFVSKSIFSNFEFSDLYQRFLPLTLFWEFCLYLFLYVDCVQKINFYIQWHNFIQNIWRKSPIQTAKLHF